MRDFFAKVLSQAKFEKPFKVIMPDGSDFVSSEGTPAFTIHFKTERAMNELLVRGSLGFGESYMAEEIDIDGDVQDIAHLGFEIFDNKLIRPSIMEIIKIAAGFYLRRNTLEGSRKNISAHYDLGNDFYSLWLDEEMQYTCAYFERPDDPLEQAQQQKMDLVCRKLNFQPGEEVVEAGCGWGHFAIFAARNYGVKMRSFNISREQIEHARQMARHYGLGPDRVEFVLDDYRIIENEPKKYDKFVSIGMLEHVGRENYGKLYDIIYKVTKPHGLALVHTIGKIAPQPTDPWLEKHIFPGGYMPSLAEIIAPLEKELRWLYVADVENLRYHYSLTLDHWSNRFEENVDAIRAKYGEAFVRKFRLYLRSAAAGFRWGGMVLFQILLSHGFNNEAPLTRHHFFAGVKSPHHSFNGKDHFPLSKNSARNGNGNGKKSLSNSVKSVTKKKTGSKKR